MCVCLWKGDPSTSHSTRVFIYWPQRTPSFFFSCWVCLGFFFDCVSGGSGQLFCRRVTCNGAGPYWNTHTHTDTQMYTQQTGGGVEGNETVAQRTRADSSIVVCFFLLFLLELLLLLLLLLLLGCCFLLLLRSVISFFVQPRCKEERCRQPKKKQTNDGRQHVFLSSLCRFSFFF